LLTIEFAEVFAIGCAAIQRGFETVLDVLFADPGDSWLADLDRFGDGLVDPAWPVRTLIGFQQDAGMNQLPRGFRARRNQTLEMIAFGFGESDNVSFMHNPKDILPPFIRQITCPKALGGF
jgi:hypothetical protein